MRFAACQALDEFFGFEAVDVVPGNRDGLPDLVSDGLTDLLPAVLGGVDRGGQRVEGLGGGGRRPNLTTPSAMRPR